MTFLVGQPCPIPTCKAKHGVVAGKRTHAAYTGPVVSPKRSGEALPNPPSRGVSPERSGGRSTPVLNTSDVGAGD